MKATAYQVRYIWNKDGKQLQANDRYSIDMLCEISNLKEYLLEFGGWGRGGVGVGGSSLETKLTSF